MSMQLSQKRIFQNSQEWNLFLEISYEYISECFSNRTLNKTKNEFIIDYSRQLSNRLMSIKEPRGLFLYYNSDQVVGLSNVFVSTNNIDTKSLYIAEFYVTPKNRDKGVGSQMIRHVIGWGKEKDSTKLGTRVETKNINSFKYLEKAVNAEIKRQSEILENGESK